ncbi:hypothetical protein, variant [Puccinia triticina 1-1 BBBD Race 1]|uniref:EamA domain-containing protein n=1 Tax=Puccinia triticina (isolate 1-1 / race 1 (BBBD)) TaxID=630390 RepID=A0A180H1R0_PUCT1|nr:hypothetical protein PTTG_02478 [Puccinia triticina 1-1 BBBD Race 1]OAV98956.1 hypothetical protein, variant [Puccinia triticina 1-1 BBBD Race 1]
MLKRTTAAAPASANRLGCLVIFILITFAYVIQTELTQAVQRTYQKPYLLLFLTHSGYIAILPLHLLLLKLLQPSIRLSTRLRQLRRLVVLQYNHQRRQHESARSPASDRQPLLLPNIPPRAASLPSQAFPLAWFVKRSVQLTLFLALPAMCWYGAVPFADMTSITSIFNTNAAFTYLFAVCFLDSERVEARKSLGVLSSLLGAFLISYAERAAPPSDSAPLPDDQHNKGRLRLLGISLALLGSIGYALYEVWYKRAIAWSEAYSSPPPAKSGLSDLEPEHHASSGSDTDIADPEFRPSSSRGSEGGPKGRVDPDSLPIREARSSLYSQDSLLHANLMTTMVGLATLCLLWIPIPLLHWTGIEPFEVVQDPAIAWMILGIILMGVLFNAGFMILIGLWGPVVASVGNLCTLVLIAIVDHTIIGAINSHDSERNLPPFGFLSALGCLSILLGFSILNF